MKSINGIRKGNVLNISLNGKLHKKICGSAKEADELYKLVRKASGDPTDANIKEIRMRLNERLRTALMAGLESDVETGEVYLAGFNTPIPATLVNIVKEYNDNGYPIDAIINFWKLLMINPDKRVRVSLFDFITTHDFVLTDKGYMLVYKAVHYSEDKKTTTKGNALDEFVTNQFLQVKKNKKSPKNYGVVKLTDGTFKVLKNDVISDWNVANFGTVVLGNLADMNTAIVSGTTFNDESVLVDEEATVYTDMHTHSMVIKLGVPVVKERVLCDADPSRDCSNGLHVGATKYVESFGRGGSVVLACLVNPANVVAVPNYDHSKMRVSEYFPFAVATYVDGKIDIVEQAYYEDDYSSHEQKEVERLIAKVQAEEPPIGKAMNAEDDDRPMSELLKILESRMLIL